MFEALRPMEDLNLGESRVAGRFLRKCVLCCLKHSESIPGSWIEPIEPIEVVRTAFVCFS